MGFNKLVIELKPVVSRGTLASKIERLTRLGYLEKPQAERKGGIKPIRVSVKCAFVMSIIETAKRKARELRESLKETLSKLERSSEKNSVKGWMNSFRDNWSCLFSMIGSMAVLYG